MNPYTGFVESVLSGQCWLALAQLCQRGEMDRRALVQELEQLERLGLACQHLLGWRPTWLGYGVHNWRLQQEMALCLDPSAVVPEPKQQENGEELGPVCMEFRETYFRPGFCWCRRRRSQHPDQIVEIANQFLQDHNQRLRREMLQRPQPARRPPPPLGPLEVAVLQAVKDANGSTLSLGELSLKLSPLFGFFALKAAVDRLLELELLVSSELGLDTTWEGRRLISNGSA